MKICVLSLQGDFAEHAEYFRKAGAEVELVKSADKIRNSEALVIPGGESTTYNRLMKQFGIIDALRELKEKGVPVFGTCNGLILLARSAKGEDPDYSLGFLDITVSRNAYGRQRESFEADISLLIDGKNVFRGIFIRAPKIQEVGPSVEVLAKLGDEPVLVRQGPFLGATFHPELTDDTRIAEYFIRLAENKGKI